MTDWMHEPHDGESHPYREDVGRLNMWPPSTQKHELDWLIGQADRFVAELQNQVLSDEDIIRSIELPDYAEGQRGFSYLDWPRVCQLRLFPFMSTHPNVRRLNVCRLDVDRAPEPGSEAFVEATADMSLPWEDRPTQFGSRHTRRLSAWVVRAYERLYEVAHEENRGASIFEMNWAARNIGLDNSEIREVMGYVAEVAEPLGLTLPEGRDDYALSPITQYVYEHDRSVTTRISDEERDQLRNMADEAPPAWEWVGADETEAEADEALEATA